MTMSEYISRGETTKVRHGEWIPISDGDWAECSECGENYDVGNGYGAEAFKLFKKYYRFCPSCGAKMDRGEG